MQRETEIQSCPIRIINDHSLVIGSEGKDWRISKPHAPELIAFIQAWLDHDPEQELIEKIERTISMTRNPDAYSIIAAVREHDAKYRKDES